MSGLPDLAEFRSVFIVKPSSLGDIVHTLPVVNLIKAAHPHLRVRWIANPEWLPLLHGAPCVDELIEFPRRQLGGVLAPWKYLRWAPTVRLPEGEGPELVLDFQGLLRSAFISKARRASYIIGLADAREGARYFYDSAVSVEGCIHAVDRYLQIAQALGISPPAREALEWPLPQGDWSHGDLPTGYVVVHPWSRGEGKSLDESTLRALLAALAPTPVILVGRTEEKLESMGSHVIDLSNRTSLTELIWLMRGAAWNISVDSGPMHIAAAVNERTLGLHTWSDPRRVGPYHPSALVWKAGRVAHAADLSSDECETNSRITPADVPGIVRALGL
jgi:heptosyltransferase I